MRRRDGGAMLLNRQLRFNSPVQPSLGALLFFALLCATTALLRSKVGLDHVFVSPRCLLGTYPTYLGPCPLLLPSAVPSCVSGRHCLCLVRCSFFLLRRLTSLVPPFIHSFISPFAQRAPLAAELRLRRRADENHEPTPDVDKSLSRRLGLEGCLLAGRVMGGANKIIIPIHPPGECHAYRTPPRKVN
ncbi:hypothetical protein BS50DRAFT_378794 [Corynespora cassiicola Philippines]|uniref:Uncharacterized protein n=1 Tax=Corynespora cassiicola Philippines TaxID=1448308 RepID=A0A2T2NNE6_CORCC|nr:hypothetical protein BS50DRAFT_378794 [Corynespora cassiicola Philippines]